jgi:uncharacterized membrane protein
METAISAAINDVRRMVEVMGAFVIAVGAIQAFARLAWALCRGHVGVGLRELRLRLGYFLALALEFQLAADVLSTAIAPSWTQLGKLASTAVIRTGLNYFLTREMTGERQANPTA